MKVVLVNPDIPWNAGNIGRTCVAACCELVFVGKLGFEISDREIRRSGLDYWQYLKYSVYPDFEKFLASLNGKHELLFFSTRGAKDYWDALYLENSCLIFGSESRGFPLDYYEKYAERMYRIPMYSDRMRSLNLSTAAGIVIYKAVEAMKRPIH